MLYSAFMLKAKEEVLSQAHNGKWYLEPEWRDILYHSMNVNPAKLSGSYSPSWEAIEDVLKLEVERRNLLEDHTSEVVDWLYDVITTAVEPAMLEEETKYIKNLTEYLKATNEKESETNVFPTQLNFEKK